MTQPFSLLTHNLPSLILLCRALRSASPAPPYLSLLHPIFDFDHLPFRHPPAQPPLPPSPPPSNPDSDLQCTLSSIILVFHTNDNVPFGRGSHLHPELRIILLEFSPFMDLPILWLMGVEFKDN